MTYTVDSNTVLRGSWGVYAQQPTGETQQIDSLEQDLPFDSLGRTLASYGFNQPGSADPTGSLLQYGLLVRAQF